MSNPDILFETYKLQSELAERISSLREGINKLYSGLIAGIVAASVLLHRLVPDTETIWVLPALGMMAAISWIFSLHSVTRRLAAKHRILLVLEEDLPFQFFSQENRVYGEERSIRRKYTELIMPALFLILCGGWLAFLAAKVGC